MKFATEYLWFNTANHREYINITDEVAEIVRNSGVQEGMVLVSAMHITAGVYVNDAESGLIADIDPADIYNKIKEMIDNPNLREKFSQTLAAENFGNESEIEKFYGLLDD